MTRGKRRARRGQAMVEAVLALLVFVTILIFGIHFAEAGFLALKTQEATNFGLWDATAYQMHNAYTPDWSLWKGAIGKANGAIQARYPDYDGLYEDGAKTITLAFTQAEPMEVSCQAEARTPTMYLVDRAEDAGYPKRAASASGMACMAKAKVTGLRIPGVFLDEGTGNGTFKVPHWQDKPLYMCGVGRATGSDCKGRLSILLDDWGFSGPDEARQCLTLQGAGCENTAYYKMVQGVFFSKNGPAPSIDTIHGGSDLAALVAGTAPAQEAEFHMSFAGGESALGPFKDTIGTSHGDTQWETTPYTYVGAYKTAYDTVRESCFLGLKCN